MYYIHHVHNSTASAQSLFLPNFLPSGPCLCVVKHTSLSFLTLADEDSDSALKNILSVPINGRILRIARIAASDQSIPTLSDRLAVLTDHHQPRLFVLVYNRIEKGIQCLNSLQRSSIQTQGSILLEELGRPAAESGLTLEVEEGIGARYAYCHSHAGKLKIARLCTENGETTEERSSSSYGSLDLAHAFSLRLPHPHLISSTFMARRGGEKSQSQIALLSLSSTASRLPGLGMQCLPVLSFHAIDESNQELQPVAWGPPRKVPSKDTTTEGSLEPTQENAGSSGVAKTRRKSSHGNDAGSSAGAAGTSSSKSGRHGPAAMGATRTAEEEAAHEEQLAKAPLTRAHVPLPFSDALGAHLLLALPARAGGGVLVFSETSVMLVPPPPSSIDAKNSESPRSPKSTSAKVAGKRRKSSSGEIVTSAHRPSANNSQTTISDAALSVSPTATVVTAPRSNENGKRRRSTAGSSSTINPASTDSGPRRRSSSAATVSSQRILRLTLPLPVIVASAIVIKEPMAKGDDGVRIDHDTGKASLKVIFATHSGRLELLTITLQNMASSQSEVEQFAPISLFTQKLGDSSAPGGPDALAYLGENFLHISSTSGDSLLLRINDQAVETGQDTENQFSVVKRWPNLAPILDFVADDGAGGNPSAADSAQTRIITCSGSGPTGSLRIIRNGVALEDLASIEERGIRRIWDIEGASKNSTVLLLLGLSQGTKVVSFRQTGIEDHTHQFESAGMDTQQGILDAASLGSGIFAIVNSSGIKVFQSEQASIRAQWKVSDASQLGLGSKPITRAAVNSAGQILLAFQTGDVLLLQVKNSDIELIAGTKLSSEISAIDISPLSTTKKGSPAKLATVALWRPAVVKILTIPDLRDVTPSTLMSSQPSLIRSVKLHTFSINGTITSLPLLMIGLGNGTLTTHSLSLPTKDSISQTIGVLERRSTALGVQPLHLRDFVTEQGFHAVFVAGDKSTVVFSQGNGLTCSSVRLQHVSDVAQLDFPVNGDGGVDRLMIFASPEQLRIARMGEISQVDVETVNLGYDNPLAISMCAAQKVVGIVTTTFLSQGRSSEPITGGKVILQDAEQFATLDEFALEMEERPNCIDTFERAGSHYFAVGTGYTFPDRTETLSGRLLILRFSPRTKRLHLVCSRNVEGNVFDLGVMDSKRIVACVNAKVLSFDVEDDDSAMNEESDEEEESKSKMNGGISLLQVGQWACAFTATSLSILSSRKIVVGDALRSIVILRIDEESGKLIELARDCDPYWTVSCNCIDEEEEVYCGSDIAFNIWTCRRLKWTQSAKDRLEQSRIRDSEMSSTRSTAVGSQNGVDLIDQTWSHIMQRDGAFHYGDLINKMKRGSLVSDSGGNGSANSKSGLTRPSVQSKIIFGTAAGAIGLIAKLDEKGGRILSQLEVKISDSFVPIGEISSEDYRTLRTDHRTQPSAGFIDGTALCDAFDPLNNQARTSLLQRGRLPIEADLDEVNNLVESLHRLS